MRKSLATVALAIPLFGCATMTAAPQERVQIQDLCKSESLIASMACVNHFVKQNYNYKITDDEYTMTRDVEDVMKNGGDCLDYALVYGALATEMGFNAELGIFTQKSGKWAHAYAVIFKEDMTEYCIADQKTLWCNQLGGVPGEAPGETNNKIRGGCNNPKLNGEKIGRYNK